MTEGSQKKTCALCVFGTRPDAIKMAPVVLELRRRADRFDTRVVVTGQHREQLDQVLRVFGITPDRDLALMRHGQTLPQLTARALEGLDAAMADVSPDVVIAQGDTTTTFVASLAAFYRQVPFAHVEAGLRTDQMYDPFPEEMNRRLTGRISSFHFAPTDMARRNLLSEGIDPAHVWVTGNTGIDALLHVARDTVRADDPAVERLLQYPERLVLVTAHRRENWGEPLASICRAVARLAASFADCRVVFAMHRNPIVRETVRRVLEGVDRVHLVEPPDYAPFVKLMKRSSLILTDSGGVQEEAPSLGVPVLVLRKTTERPEGVAAGVTRLVGTDEDEVYSEASALLSDVAAHDAMAHQANPYGDGSAASRICDILAEHVTG